MTAEVLENIGLTKDLIEKILLQSQIDSELIKDELCKQYERQISSLKLEFLIERALTAAGAKNLKAVRALISVDMDNGNDENTSDEETMISIEKQIEELVSNDDTSFLFGNRDFKFIGLRPAEKSETKPDIDAMSYSEFVSLKG
ncbi:MAG: phage scaffolding protein [Eubacterium sp.]|jgi:hypothetical protein|nr:phage scaffolding protein [Eubacterium sp.]